MVRGFPKVSFRSQSISNRMTPLPTETKTAQSSPQEINENLSENASSSQASSSSAPIVGQNIEVKLNETLRKLSLCNQKQNDLQQQIFNYIEKINEIEKQNGEKINELAFNEIKEKLIINISQIDTIKSQIQEQLQQSQLSDAKFDSVKSQIQEQVQQLQLNEARLTVMKNQLQETEQKFENKINEVTEQNDKKLEQLNDKINTCDKAIQNELNNHYVRLSIHDTQLNTFQTQLSSQYEQINNTQNKLSTQYQQINNLLIDKNKIQEQINILNDVTTISSFAQNQIQDGVIETHNSSQLLSEDTIFEELNVSDLDEKQLFGYHLYVRKLLVDDILSNNGFNGLNGFVNGVSGQLEISKHGSMVGGPVFNNIQWCLGGKGTAEPVGPTKSSDSTINLSSEEDINYEIAAGLQVWSNAKYISKKIKAAGLQGTPIITSHNDITYGGGGGGFIYIEADEITFTETGRIMANGENAVSRNGVPAGGGGGGIIVIKAKNIHLPQETQRPIVSTVREDDPFIQVFGGLGASGGQDGNQGLIFLFA